MIKTSITCDACEKDLSDSGPRPMFMLTLNASPVSSTSSIRYAIHVTPAIDRPHHFCGKRCLNSWLNPPIQEHT